MEGKIESKILKVMELAIKFIGKLDEEELDNLINKSSRFEIKNKNENSSKIKNTKKKEEYDFKDVVNNIKDINNRDEGVKYINNLKFTKDKLISLGKELGINIQRKNKKNQIINIIVENTIGTKLKIEGLRKGIMK